MEYKEAKEKFKYCISLPNENKQRLLNTILNVLEGTPSLIELKRLSSISSSMTSINGNIYIRI